MGDTPRESISHDDTAAVDRVSSAMPHEAALEVVANYRLIRLIGKGGMGSVYEATHVHLATRAAVKFVNPELSVNQDMVQRFFNEALAATKVAHPGIVRVLDFGHQPDGRAYIVMELLTGRTLKDVLARGALDVLRASSIGADLADVLYAAHQASIVHRDLKPDNIFLVADPERQGRERVKVLDFGIAKLTGESDGTLTRTGALMGTPLYMSPEQASGAGEVDHRTDIYSLGCVLYEALAGRPVFDERGMGEILGAHLHKQPRRLRDHRRGVPTPLDDLVHRMLAKDPARRPQTMIEVSEDLRRVIGATPPRGFVAVGRAPHGSGVSGRTQPMFRPDRPGQVADSEPWSALRPALPPHMRAQCPALQAFLASVFSGSRPAEPGMIALTDPHIPYASGQEFFALFVADEKDQVANAAPLPTLDTGRFRQHYLTRLEAFLRTRPGGGTRVIIAIASTGAIGRGVRELILAFRRENDAIVIPVYVGEILAAHRDGNERRLFNDRLHALHTLPDPFAMRGAADPTAFYGMNADLNRLVDQLSRRGGFISITGQPGSGKSALVRQADFAFQDRQFVYLRCPECSERTPRAFMQDLLAKLLPLGSGLPTGEIAEIKSRAVASAIAGRLEAPAIASAARACPVLVLEDADWLIHAIASSTTPEPQQGEARAVWSGLAEIAVSERLTIVVTSVRGFELRQRFADWDNPVRPEHIAIAPLKVHDLRLVIDRLGSTIDFHFDETLEQGHDLAGGNVFVARAICSQVVQLYRARPRHHILQRVDVGPEYVAQAARELAAVPALFEPVFTSWLSPTERSVLHFVATVQPRKARAVRRDLGRRAHAALSALREMGLVTLRDDRYRLAIPLMEDWVREHIDAADDHDDKRRKRRIRALAIGGTLAAISLALYFAFRSGWGYSTWERVQEGCTYRVGYPERVATGEDKVGMTFNRDCRASSASTARSIVIRGDEASVPPIPVGTMETVPVTATLLGHPERFTFWLEVDGARSPPFTIERDRLATFKEGLSTTSQMAAIVSLAFGVFFAFFFEVKKGIKRAFDAIRGAEDEPPPEAKS